jgi:Ca-activated chloride channel family protein
MVILLLSDGANTSGRTQPLVAADHARQLGVPIYAIALGTQSGTVDVPDESGQLRTTPVPPPPSPQTRAASKTSRNEPAVRPSPPQRQ